MSDVQDPKFTDIQNRLSELEQLLKPKEFKLTVGGCSSDGHCWVNNNDRCQCGEITRLEDMTQMWREARTARWAFLERQIEEQKAEAERLRAFVQRVHQHCPDAATVLVAGQVLEGHDVRTVSRMAYQPKG